MDQSSKKSYKSGLCNIGEREVIIRQKLLLISFFATVALTILAHFCHWKLICFSLFFSSFVTILIIIEIKMQFCILFAFFNLHNFKELGNLDNVEHPECKRKDRRRAMQIITGSALLALPYTFLIWFFANG
jgi:hypothetical protein